MVFFLNRIRGKNKGCFWLNCYRLVGAWSKYLLFTLKYWLETSNKKSTYYSSIKWQLHIMNLEWENKIPFTQKYVVVLLPWKKGLWFNARHIEIMFCLKFYLLSFTYFDAEILCLYKYIYVYVLFGHVAQEMSVFIML